MKNDLMSEVNKIFSTDWKTRQGKLIPDTTDIQLGNDAVTFEEVSILYADLAESTNLVDNYKDSFSAEIYKAYLHCASKIIKNNGGNITAFDGDRIMAIFIDNNNKVTNSVISALQINYAVNNIINPSIKNKYPNESYRVKQSVGIDISKIFIARTGIRGSNDLVWVGKAANYAAKLCNLRQDDYCTFITEEAYEKINEQYKINNSQNIWEKFYWIERGIYCYKSNYHYSFC